MELIGPRLRGHHQSSAGVSPIFRIESTIHYFDSLNRIRVDRIGNRCVQWQVVRVCAIDSIVVGLGPAAVGREVVGEAIVGGDGGGGGGRQVDPRAVQQREILELR